MKRNFITVCAGLGLILTVTMAANFWHVFVSGARLLLAAGAEPIPHAAAPPNTPGVPPGQEGDNVLVGAGDIADCSDLRGAVATSIALESIPGTIVALGDTGCPEGSEENFKFCYAPTWGRFKDRTRPAPGNHEYHTPGAGPYFKFFGAVAGEPGKGYYSYEQAGWHIISLNSDCSDIGGCDAGSPEEQWLRQDLATHPAKCTLAYWHHPLFSSGSGHGNAPQMKVFWQDLYSAGADVVLGGHDHDYERFAQQDPDGNADPARGIREFVVGTGGRHRRPFGVPKPHSEVRDSDSFGVLKLTLFPDRYAWQFIPVGGAIFTDVGEGPCH